MIIVDFHNSFRYSFPIFQKGNWGSENFRCVTNSWKHKKMYIASNHYVCDLVRQLSVKSTLKYLWRTTLLWRIRDMKNQVRILILESKKSKEHSPRSRGQARMASRRCLCELVFWCSFFMQQSTGPNCTPALLINKYCKSSFSIWLSSQLPSAFWEVKGPSEPVTFLLRAKCTLYSSTCLSTAHDMCQLSLCETQITPMIQLESTSKN